MMYHPLKKITLICLTILLTSCVTEPQNKSDKTIVAPQIITSNTDKALELNSQAVKEIEDHNLNKAKKLLTESIKNDKMIAKVHNNLGKVFYLQKNLYQAAWEYQYAIKLNPKLAQPHHNLAITYQAATQMDKALPYYITAHKLAPQNPTYLSSLAQAHLKLGHKTQKVQELLKQLIFHTTNDKQKSWAKKHLKLLQIDQ